MTKTFHSVTLAFSVASLAALATTGCSSEVPEEEAESAPAALGEAAGGPTGEMTCSDTGGWCTCKGTKSCGKMFWLCKSHLVCNSDPAGGLRCICWTHAGRAVGGHGLDDVSDLTSTDGFN